VSSLLVTLCGSSDIQIFTVKMLRTAMAVLTSVDHTAD